MVTLMAFIAVFSVLAVVIPAVANAPGGGGMRIPSAMNLTADPEWIYIDGNVSLITATVYDNENYTVPMSNVVVNFTTSRGILTNVGEGGSITDKNCWAITNESGVAIVALAPVIGSESGVATVKAVTGKGDVWKEVTVEFVKAEWRVVLFPDEESKETGLNENATYYIEVRNAGTVDDTYDLSVISNEADDAWLNRTSVSVAANESEIVELNVRDSSPGSYNTTVRAASAHASWEISVKTIVKPRYEVGLEVTPENQTVLVNENATYKLTVKNLGDAADTIILNITLNEADVGALSADTFTLNANESATAYLNVSDADVGVYNTTVRATSQGNTSVFDEVTVKTTVIAPDLIVTDITLNCGYLFANESNVVCAEIKNNGSVDAGAFNVSFDTDGFSEEVRVGGLAAGEDTEVCITDPTERNAGESVTITVTADCGTEIEESDDANNVRSEGETVVNNGYKGKRYTGGEDISTWRTYEVNGSVLYSVGDSYYLSAWSHPHWTTYSVNWSASDLAVPAGATVVEARLYVIYTWDKAGVMPDEVSLTFNGNGQPLEKHYSDRKGYGPSTSDRPYGMLAYNVTADFDTGGNTAILMNTHPGGGNVSMRGMLLVVIYEKEGEPKRAIFVNEGFDLLYGGAGQCTTPEEATAYAPFAGAIEDIANKSARLITVAPGASEEGELIFNGHVWSDVWSFAGATQIGIDDRDVTAYLNATANEAGFQSSEDYMEASNAILVVEEKPGDTEAPVVTNPNASTRIIPEDTDNNPTCSGTLYSETSQLNVTITDESNITSVTINLSAIGGSAVQAMTNIPGTNIWTVITNASAGTAGWNGSAYVPYELQVNATDEYGNSNTSVCVELTVMKNGDVTGDGTVDFTHDGLYLVRYTLNVPGYEELPVPDNVADVTGDCTVDFTHDGLYLVRYTLNVPGYEVLH